MSQREAAVVIMTLDYFDLSSQYSVARRVSRASAYCFICWFYLPNSEHTTKTLRSSVSFEKIAKK